MVEPAKGKNKDVWLGRKKCKNKIKITEIILFRISPLLCDQNLKEYVGGVII